MHGCMPVDARNQRIVEMAKNRIPRGEIARQFGISLNLVRVVLSRARHHDDTVPLGTNGGRLLPDDIREGLAEAASARGITADTLAWEILKVVIDDDLVNAILDDGAVS